jgi:diadenosine tetraphosphatase ApaH/serine/threonine PP2A family protein phosphatase
MKRPENCLAAHTTVLPQMPADRLPWPRQPIGRPYLTRDVVVHALPDHDRAVT